MVSWRAGRPVAAPGRNAVHDGQVNPARFRLYLDEDVPVQIAAPLRRAGFDVLTTREAGRLQAEDPDQLAFAAREGRVLITLNRDDFVRFTKQFAAEGAPHAGVLILSRSFARGDYGSMARAIDRYLREHPHGIAPYLADFVTPATGR